MSNELRRWMRLVEMATLHEMRIHKIPCQTGREERVWENLTHTETLSLLASVKELRGTATIDSVFVWDAYSATHWHILPELIKQGLMDEVEGEYENFVMMKADTGDDFVEWDGEDAKVVNGIAFVANGSPEALPHFRRMLGK